MRAVKVGSGKTVSGQMAGSFSTESLDLGNGKVMGADDPMRRSKPAFKCHAGGPYALFAAFQTIFPANTPSRNPAATGVNPKNNPINKPIQNKQIGSLFLF